jgi:AraC family transcriptional regulator of adaptative response/methylated-DNA-[protein]-cysteine methyltransferase
VALLEQVDAEPDLVWSEAELAARGYDARTVRRIFQRAVGTSFLKMVRARRLAAGTMSRSRGASMIEAQHEAGFESGQGFRNAIGRLLHRSPAELASPSPLALAVLKTPLGPMVTAATDEGLWLLEFADRPELAAELAAVGREAQARLSLGDNRGTSAIAAEVNAYFEGDMNAFASVPVRYGTAFTSSVHDQLRAIPPGTTISYRQLAERIGRPGAFRAVARANAANRLALIVPCHRVIAASGKISGYAGGVWRKEWLLQHERKWTAGGLKA